MIKKLTSLPRKSLLILSVLVVGAGIFFYMRGDDNKTNKTQSPKYLNFSGEYVFDIPKDYSVDEQSVPGAQLVYSGQITVKILEDVYNAGGISVYGISDLTDYRSRGFNDYVNNIFIPDLKKNLATSDMQTKFGKANGADNVSITVKKDGKVIRFIYLKGGKHPAVVLAKTQTNAAAKIDETIADVEASTLKNEADSIKQAIQNVGQLARDQKAQELYSSATPELRSKNTQDEIVKALKIAAPYTTGNITISGGSYGPSEFSAAIRFTTPGKDNQLPAFGSMVLKKIEGQWKLQALSLPTPKQ